MNVFGLNSNIKLSCIVYHIGNCWANNCLDLLVLEEYRKTFTRKLQLLNKPASYAKTKIIIIIVSKEYNEKPWTRFERKTAMNNFVFNGGRILQIKVDQMDLPGLPQSIICKNYDGNINNLGAHIISILRPNAVKDLVAENPIILKVMKACSRRSIFTNMDSEINFESMFNSVRSCIGQLNNLLPEITDKSLSQHMKSIVSDLDQIDRFSKKGIHYTCSFNSADKKEMDSLKLHIIDMLHFLNYHYRAAIDLPNNIGFDYKISDYEFLLD